MAIISGGIFSKPRGKIGGLVAGAARTRQGKMATLRELVAPSNPRTPSQVTQRNKFKSTLDIVRRLGSSIYRTAFNRAVGQLPGFQSMMSIFLSQMSATKLLDLVIEINLGSLPVPTGLSISSPSDGVLKVIWDGTLPSPLLAGDKINMFVIARTDATRELPQGVVVAPKTLASSKNSFIVGLEHGEVYEVYLYVEGQGANAGNYSNAIPFSQLV